MSDSYDLYKVLGLNKEASQEDIKRAFRRLALQHHPDKNEGNDIEFKRINEAYQILSDADKRKVYDMKYEDNINLDILSKFASILMNIVHDKLKERVKQTSQVSKPSPIILTMSVDVEEIYNAKVKKLIVKVKRRNPCGGFNFERKPLYISLLNYKDEYVFAGQGDDAENGQGEYRGDIVVKLDIKSTTPNEVNVDTMFCKYDLHMECKMSLYEYFYGIDTRVPYFNNETINIKVIPSARHNIHSDDYYNYVHEVNDKGLPYVEKNEEDLDEAEVKRGKLFIYFKLSIDTMSIDKLEEHKSFFRTYFNGTSS